MDETSSVRDSLQQLATTVSSMQHSMRRMEEWQLVGGAGEGGGGRGAVVGRARVCVCVGGGGGEAAVRRAPAIVF